ncbi:efflux RND transporter periplasmic adaptor subunit [Kiloniella laminariae]|uniref:Efflux RND transporter periplasmic adaptor subunit n=1 Tax=Kiloniella laminariae TaxID=454162 RepID=A0ABT4LHV7_9PROT|nr:efflux RND transporter periplasmic adaptor subunit [Kiloniella laminariae]MCZ4280690.1 efflux RND transporter periplasmic adaptor subunit [Kiloniella laminariae]
MTNNAPQSTSEGIPKPPGVGKSHARWLWIVISLITLFGVIFLLVMEEDTADITRTGTPAPLQLVSFEKVQTGPETLEITSFAEIRPRWSAELRAAVSGRIDKVHDNALAGEAVDKGTTLIEIENSRYVAELAAAELALKEAELELLKAKNANYIAQKEFERSSRKAPNDFALKIPQLEIAKQSVTSANARVRAARQQLEDTTILAPFPAFITRRFVSPGQMVNVGDQLLKLVDNTRFELEAEIGRREWNLLQKPFEGLEARITGQAGELIAQAKIRRGGGFLDEATRQYKIFLVIEETAPSKVLSGDFVKLSLPGITISEALDIPASSLTKDGYLWYLDSQDRLQRLEPLVLSRRDDRIIIQAPAGEHSWRFAITPLVSFLPGQKVYAREKEK